jgi:hypothetical protein
MAQRTTVKVHPLLATRAKARLPGRRLLLSERGPVPEKISHYTDAAGALNIIKSGAIWATDALFMNDASELQLATDIFRAKLGRWLGQNINLKVNRDAFAHHFWDAFGGSGELGENPLYIACFCVEDDLLSQWRAYAKGGQGYSMQFDASTLDAWLDNGAELLSVIYEPERHNRLARDLVVNGINAAKKVRPSGKTIKTSLYQMAGRITGQLARTFAYRIKHKSFAEEQEWRLVYQAPPMEKPGEESKPRPREFRAGERGIVPYVVMDFPPVYHDPNPKPDLPLVSVRTGPTAHPALAARAVRYLLDDHGYRDIEVLKSSVPLRA